MVLCFLTLWLCLGCFYALLLGVAVEVRRDQYKTISPDFYGPYEDNGELMSYKKSDEQMTLLPWIKGSTGYAAPVLPTPLSAAFWCPDNPNSFECADGVTQPSDMGKWTWPTNDGCATPCVNP